MKKLGRNFFVRASKQVTLAALTLCALLGCSGGGGDISVEQPAQSGQPPQPARQSNCERYSVSVDSRNNFVTLSLPDSAAPPANADERTLQEWTACVLRAGNISGLYEHIVFVNGVSTTPPTSSYYGRSHLVSNSVQGLGIPIFDEWAEWGVNGSLRSVLHFPSIESFVAGPKLHELAHAWGAFVLEGDEFSGLRGHWAFSSANGQLGGFDRELLRFLGPIGACPQAFAAARSPLNTIQPFFSAGGNGGDDMPYSTIELYLMGLADAAELPQTTIVAPGAYFIGNGNLQFCAPNGLLEYPTRSWLEGRHGPRVPSAFNTVPTRNVLFVAVSPSYVAMPQQELVYWELLACEINDFSMRGPNRLSTDFNYWEATNGRGSLSVPRTSEVCQTCARFADSYPSPSQLRQQCSASFPDIF